LFAVDRQSFNHLRQKHPLKSGDEAGSRRHVNVHTPMPQSWFTHKPQPGASSAGNSFDLQEEGDAASLVTDDNKPLTASAGVSKKTSHYHGGHWTEPLVFCIVYWWWRPQK
jgi:hypothetical protein